MTLVPFIAWGLVLAVGLLAAVFACSQLRPAMRRRARRLQMLHAELEGAPAAPVKPAISREQVASISSDAQQAAWRVARNVDPHATNPHPARTREFVLWEATFHSALSDFAELAEGAEAAAPKDDATQ